MSRGSIVVYPGLREVCLRNSAGKDEYHRRTMAMCERQDGRCALCGGFMGNDVTFDHERSRGMGGGFRDDRIEVDGRWQNAAVHFRCNSLKGSRRMPYMVTQP